MAINYSSLIKLPKPDAGTPAWTTYWHRLADQVDALAGKVVTVTKTTGATTFADLDGTADNGKAPIIRSAVTLTGNVTITVPGRNRVILAENMTSGAFTWKIQVGSNGVTVPQGKRMWLRSTSTGVIPISRTDGRSTATEIGIGVITATHLAASSVTTAKIGSGVVTATKLAAAGSYGRLLVSQTGAFRWAELARGTSRQILAMSTAASTMPGWVTPPFSRVATSTGIAYPSAGSIATYTHGLTGISNIYDYGLIRVAAVCLTTDGSYSVGDVVFLTGTDYGDAGGGYAILADSTSSVKFLNSNLGTAFMNKSTGAGFNITASRWALRFKVFV